CRPPVRHPCRSPRPQRRPAAAVVGCTSATRRRCLTCAPRSTKGRPQLKPAARAVPSFAGPCPRHRCRGRQRAVVYRSATRHSAAHRHAPRRCTCAEAPIPETRAAAETERQDASRPHSARRPTGPRCHGSSCLSACVTPTDRGAADIRSALTAVFGSAPEVKTFGSDRQFKITTTYKINDNSQAVDAEVEEKLWQGMSGLYQAKPSQETFKANYLMSSQKVGPTIADDIKASAIWSILFALVAIFVYIVIRFRKWQYAFGATVALAHDVLVVLAVFTLGWKWFPFSMEIDQAFIAAILTIVGYSINDTVVVFDRIREDLGTKKLTADKSIMNNALNTTLSRTLITAFTTIITVVVLFLFGGDVIKSFSFAILIGLIVGTYSSIFTASALVLDTVKWMEGRSKR
ncbi:MAG: protein translocase subunit SecF, partial [Sphingobacteriia bacterium]|nr:protein translocase subunit SecF [Sphingobacteriia bacterium]